MNKCERLIAVLKEYKLQASMTVEGSWIISICLIYIGIGIMLGYGVYCDSAKFILTDVNKVEVVKLFRAAACVKQFLGK
ncbi:MAG: hypothetical protein K6B67_09975 [Lachnospiraceae bacterium]|nr:hypothetical protein [Lachnospiraceae bacterium]